MPGPVIPTPVLIIKAQCVTAGGFFANISYWNCVTPPTSGFDVNAMCASFAAIYAPLYIACMQGNSAYGYTYGTWKDGATEFLGSSGAGAGPGTAGGVGVSDQNAVVIQKKTGLAGRQNRGRYFIGGMSSLAFAAANPDEVSGGLLPAYQALAAAYASDQTFGPSLVHARHWDRKDNVLRVITACLVGSRVASRDDRRRHAPQFSL